MGHGSSVHMQNQDRIANEATASAAQHKQRNGKRTLYWARRLAADASFSSFVDCRVLHATTAKQGPKNSRQQLYVHDADPLIDTR